jgi:hypothetical protein
MSSGIVGAAVDTCEIVWWSGYVKGRFQAYTSRASEAPELIAESPAIRWRASDPPGPTEAAVQALEVLTSRLAEEGWVVAERSGDTWFGLLLTRPSSRPHEVAADEHEAIVAEPVVEEDRLESALLAELRRELREARDETERERRLRLEAESGALRLVEPLPVSVSEQTSMRPRVVVVGYAVAIGIAAAIFLLGFQSLYASVVAALTTAAVSLALDSWLVARRRT